MTHAVRCPRCRNLSRVGADALGRLVACPHCGDPFPAAPDPAFAPDPPIARRAAPRPRPAPPADDGPTVGPHADHAAAPEHGPPHAGPPPALIGLVLLPLGIPLLWLAAPALTGVEPIFSFAAPVALAVGLCGLGLGVAFAHGWSEATRVKAVLGLVMVGYFTGGFLYFLKKEWAEAVRRHVGPGELKWHEFKPPHDAKAYTVKLPGKVTALEEHKALPGWGLRAYRFARDAQNAFGVVYEVAHGVPPADVAGKDLSDDDWFDKAREAVCRGCDGGEVTRERPVHNNHHPGREYVLTLPDGATNRIVRVFRAGDRAFYLAVEGAFVPDDAGYVRTFFDSFRIEPK